MTAGVHLRIEDLHKSYGENEVLQGVTLDVQPSKIHLIIGPSGSGKTVLMRQIIRIEQPDSGKILVDGEDIATLDEYALIPFRRKFGMVFQLNALFDSMSVYDNVAFMLREHTKMKPKEIRERVMDRLTILGVEKAAARTPAELSGGMQKRVAVARALVMEPAILIYDEPTTGLDPVMARKVDELIQETSHRFGVTSLVISHDMVSVFQVADYVSFLFKGKIHDSGRPEDILAGRSSVTSDFLRASGISVEALFEATRRGKGEA